MADETHPADGLDLDELISDFAFGRPCFIPEGVVGDSTRVVFGQHWPRILQTIREYRARVDELEAELRAATGKGAACDLAVFTRWWAGAIDPDLGPTQSEIAAEVTAAGHSVSQATVSRRIATWLTRLHEKMDGTD